MIDVVVAKAVAVFGGTQLAAMEIVAVRVSVFPHVFVSRAQKDVVVVIAGLVMFWPVPTCWLVSPAKPRYQVTVTGVAVVNATDRGTVPPDVTC